MRGAVFSPDGARIATASQDRTARLWDAASGLPLDEPLAHDEPVQSVAFDAGGAHLVTASLDGTARIWDGGPTGDAPAWFIEFAEQHGGWKLDENEKPVRVPWRMLTNADTADDDWTRLAAWLLKTGPERTINAATAGTVREFAAEQVKRGTPAALNDANDALPGNALVLAALASEIGNRVPADFLCRHAARLAPQNAAVHYRIALARRKFGQPDEALTAIEAAIRLDPANAAYSKLRDEITAPH